MCQFPKPSPNSFRFWHDKVAPPIDLAYIWGKLLRPQIDLTKMCPKTTEAPTIWTVSDLCPFHKSKISKSKNSNNAKVQKILIHNLPLWGIILGWPAQMGSCHPNRVFYRKLTQLLIIGASGNPSLMIRASCVNPWTTIKAPVDFRKHSQSTILLTFDRTLDVVPTSWFCNVLMMCWNSL